jgi:hypothetical protein
MRKIVVKGVWRVKTLLVIVKMGKVKFEKCPVSP